MPLMSDVLMPPLNAAPAARWVVSSPLELWLMLALSRLTRLSPCRFARSWALLPAEPPGSRRLLKLELATAAAAARLGCAAAKAEAGGGGGLALAAGAAEGSARWREGEGEGGGGGAWWAAAVAAAAAVPCPLAEFPELDLCVCWGGGRGGQAMHLLTQGTQACNKRHVIHNVKPAILPF
jgi:hypothetical protein